jgi:ADP-ribose pyrophosphatase YjhB (NUDIX family)
MRKRAAERQAEAADLQWKPNVTVAAIVERSGKFLLVEEMADGNPVLNQPAGHLDAGETLAAAVAREVTEETGWEFQPDFLVGVYFYTQMSSGITYLRFCFAGRLLKQVHARPPDDSILRNLWMSRAEIEQSHRARSPLVLRCIDDFLAGRRFPLNLIYHHGAS